MSLLWPTSRGAQFGRWSTGGAWFGHRGKGPQPRLSCVLPCGAYSPTGQDGSRASLGSERRSYYDVGGPRPVAVQARAPKALTIGALGAPYVRGGSPSPSMTATHAGAAAGDRAARLRPASPASNGELTRGLRAGWLPDRRYGPAGANASAPVAAPRARMVF